jgi:precorrin-6B methylase 2
MPHQGDAAALRGAVEKGNLRAVLLKRISVDHGRRVGVGMDTISIAWLICNHSCAIAVDTNLIAVDDL